MPSTFELRARVESCCSRLGMAPALRTVRAAATAVMPGARRLRGRHARRFAAFQERYRDVLVPGRRTGAGRGVALMIAGGFPPCIEAEIAVIKGLQSAGYDVVVALGEGTSRFVAPYYRMAGVREFHWSKTFRVAPDVDGARARLRGCASLEDVCAIHEDGIRVGLFAVSSALRRSRRGSLNPGVSGDRRLLVQHLIEARQAARAARRMIQAIRPALAVFVDTEYTPNAELFDAALADGVSVLQYDIGHKSNRLMLRRYNALNRNHHPWSLSDDSWRQVRSMEWTDEHRARVEDELVGTYRSGDWFSACGTQFHTQEMTPDELRLQLGLDPAKKTAVIFSHILWDAPVIWGTRLFSTYEEWLVETVRAACRNPRLNWLVKIHPANVGKGLKEGFAEEPAEVRVIREQIGDLPSHVRLLPASTRVSTLSLFSVTDYCLTVRGTAGLEAARLGIPVLNAGGGRYDRRGFTLDPVTRDEYIQRLGRLETVPRLTAAQRELADRFAYGYLFLRPLQLTSVAFTFKSETDASGAPVIAASGEILLRGSEEWETAPDVRALSEWLQTEKADFLQRSSPEATHDWPSGLLAK
jgi:hypothetical protein